jgi:hypothetical protein
MMAEEEREETINVDTGLDSAEKEAIAELEKLGLDDLSYIKKAREIIQEAELRMGVTAISDIETWDQENIVHRVLHYMRWEPSYLMDCSIQELHEFQMALCAHIVWVQSKENYWDSMCSIAKRNFDRNVKKASIHMPGKSVGERVAAAMSQFPQLQVAERRLDAYCMYQRTCSGMTQVLTGADHALKKTIARREYEKTYSKR